MLLEEPDIITPKWRNNIVVWVRIAGSLEDSLARLIDSGERDIIEKTVLSRNNIPEPGSRLTIKLFFGY